MFWVVPVAEGMADDLVSQYPGVPGAGQPEQAFDSTGGLIHGLHGPRMPASRYRRSSGCDPEGNTSSSSHAVQPQHPNEMATGDVACWCRRGDCPPATREAVFHLAT